MAFGSHDYYEVLGVAPDASADDVHRAYRRLARRYHPDLNADADAHGHFNELSIAYEVLHDPERRAKYDRSRPRRAAKHAPQRAPAFTTMRPARDVPRFLDEQDEELSTTPGGPARAHLVFIWELPRRPRFEFRVSGHRLPVAGWRFW